MSFKGKEVVVTGGAGFIGSNLTLRLLQLEATVTVIDPLLNDCGGNEFNLSPCKDDIVWIRKQISKSDEVISCLQKADFVYHLAGHIGHQRSMIEPLFDLESNLVSTIQLLEICKTINPSAKIVFTSTRQIYGTPQYLPVDESHPIAPPDTNGIHKWACENYMQLYNRIFGLKTFSLRLSNVYGPRMAIRNNQLSAIGWFVNRAITNNSIEIFGDGKQRRDFIYVDDVVDALICSAQVDSLWGKSLNLSGPTDTIVGIAEKLISASSSGSLKIIPFPEDRKKIEIGDYYGSSLSFSKLADWSAKISINEGLTRTIAFFKDSFRSYL